MVTTPPEQAAVETALPKATRLATLPAITIRILEVLDNPDVTAKALEQLVSSDPVLSARVLKVVNSSFYGMPAEVHSIKHAIVLLGLGGLKNIALAASLAKIFGGMPADGSFDPQEIWRHSSAVAAAAKLISKEIGVDGEEMYLAGLLHDVGTVMALQALRRQFTELVNRRIANPDEPHEVAERECLGATHEQLGVALCRSWNFPKTIQAAIEFHHNPEAAEEAFRRTARIICLADHIVVESGIGYCSAPAKEGVPEKCIADLGLSAARLDFIREHIHEEGGLLNEMPD